MATSWQSNKFVHPVHDGTELACGQTIGGMTVTVRGHDEYAGELTADQTTERSGGERRGAARR